MVIVLFCCWCVCALVVLLQLCEICIVGGIDWEFVGLILLFCRTGHLSPAARYQKIATGLMINENLDFCHQRHWNWPSGAGQPKTVGVPNFGICLGSLPRTNIYWMSWWHCGKFKGADRAWFCSALIYIPFFGIKNKMVLKNRWKYFLSHFLGSKSDYTLS